MFHDYMKNAGVKNGRRALIDLFRVLDAEPKTGTSYMDAEYAAFPLCETAACFPMRT
jgi:hypothetical protein